MIHFAIVGCGHIAKKHAEQIEQIEGAKLTAVCDTVRENMEPYVQKYHVEAFEDFTEMLQQVDIDVINICTPSGSHASLTVQAANAKKHVIVEKPMAMSLEEADQMISVCKKNGVKLTVVHPNRFRPVMQALRKAIDNHLFGKMSHANATVRWNRDQAYYDQSAWRGTKAMDGGVLMNQSIHNLDLLLWFMGEVDEVFSMEATRLRNIEAEDVSVGVVKFKSGALGLIEAATTIYPKNLEESLSIFGEKGTAVIGGKTANYIKHWCFEGINEQETKDLIKQIETDPYGKPGHYRIIEDMIEAIKNDRDPVVTGQDGRNVLALVLALYKSAELHQPIKL